jgi:hypothetical protein
MIEVLGRLGCRFARAGGIGIGQGCEARSRRDADELEHGAALHEFVLPYAEHPWLQDRPGGAHLIQQGRRPAERGD